MEYEFETNGAEFSPDRSCRYVLWRRWNKNLPNAMFIGLNPSTANETTDDPTIRRIKRFASDWGYGSVFMLNCFAYVSSDPKAIEPYANDPKWEWSRYCNEIRLLQINEYCKKRVFAWGNFDIVRKLKVDEKLKLMFPDAYCLGKNANGSPKHPLYLKADTKLIKY